MYDFTGILPLRAIGRIALRLGERDEADAAARHLQEEAGGDVEVLLFCADWHAVRSETEAALADVDAALAAQPRRHRVRFARASLLQQARRTEEARTVLADLVRESHGNWRYRAALAELLDGVGEIAAARRQWREAHRSAPDVPSIARAVGRLEGEERALVRAREDAQRAVGSALGATLEALDADSRAALVGAEQDWRSLEPGDDHSTVVTQLAKAIEIELMRRVFAPFRSRGAALSDAREDVGGFGKWCRGEIPSLSLGEMAFAFGGLARDDVSPLLDAFRTHVTTATDATYDLGERLAMPLRALAARRNAAVHKERVSRAEAEDSRRSVLGREGRRSLIAEIVDRFGAG
jgi:tetratricopeptide (TPR) repeat protein